MKKTIYGILGLLIFAITLNSCVKDTDYDTPQINCVEESISGTEVSISSVISQWSALNPGGADDLPLEFGDTNNYIKGYVVSSDQTGNFYKELFIQDSPNNPTAAIKLSIDISSLYARFPIGSIVYVALKDLEVNKMNGEIVLGNLVDGSLDSMSEKTAKANISRSCEMVTIDPVVLESPDEINTSHIGKFVTINNMQFTEGSLGSTYVHPEDSYDSYNNLLSCADGSTLKLETSTFASFKDVLVPSGNGSISGIISRNYYDDYFVLKINSPSDVVFEGERCNLTITPTMSLSEFMDRPFDNEIILPDAVVEAYVVSSDATGNFYKNIYIQDSPSNPTVGLQIIANEYDLYKKYPVGSKVYLKPHGLYYGTSYDVPTLGYYGASYPSQIDSGEIDRFLINSGETTTIIPTVVSFNEDFKPVIKDTNEPVPTGILVTIDDLQIDYCQIGTAYAFLNGTGSVSKSLIHCETGSAIIMRNSGYATFANDVFPSGNGTVTAVMTAYYDTPQLVIRNTSDISLEGERCDAILDDGFEGGMCQWTPYSVSGDQEWVLDTSHGNPGSCAKMSGYAGGSNENEDWLISRAIDLNGLPTATLTFETARNYSGPDMEVKMSTDYAGNGDPYLATWTDLSATLSTGSWSWTPSGDIDLSTYINQEIYIAFVYYSTSSSSATYEVDNVKIEE